MARGVSDAPAMANANGHDHGIDFVPGLQSTPPRPKLCLSLKVCMRLQTRTHLRLNFALLILSQLFPWFISHHPFLSCSSVHVHVTFSITTLQLPSTHPWFLHPLIIPSTETLRVLPPSPPPLPVLDLSLSGLFSFLVVIVVVQNKRKKGDEDASTTSVPSAPRRPGKEPAAYGAGAGSAQDSDDESE